MSALLTLKLLGPFAATYAGGPLSHFRTRAVQALLIYLACQPEPHQREGLMALLWPGVMRSSAQNSLRQALYYLRQAVPEVTAREGRDPVPLVLADRQIVRVNPEATLDLDVATFERQLKGPQAQWQEAVALYRGDFLCDFYLPDSAQFEEWVLARRADLRRQAMDALDLLIAGQMEQGTYDSAEEFARQQLAIDNLHELAHRRLMQILLHQGRRNQALALYDTYCRLLEEELGVEPDPETTRLCEDIRRGQQAYQRAAEGATPAASASAPGPLPPWLLEKSDLACAAPFFVAREKELRQLEASVAQAVGGKGGVYFLSGGPGSGKTHLMLEVARRAMQKHPDLLVLWGECNAYTGQGDPYLPFVNITRMLAGAAESIATGNVIFRESARRLWQQLPLSVTCLLDSGPQLVSHFVADSGARAAVFRHSALPPALQQRLETHIQHAAGQPVGPPSQAAPLALQFVQVVAALARHHPLLLIVDDLQWIDRCSVDLLFHLARRLPASRILLLGAYRPGELSLGHEGTGRLLSGVIEELQAAYGDIVIDLGQCDGLAFVEALVDSEPNELGPEFRRLLYRHTNGNPLFTVELLRAMQLRQDLQRNRQGKWVQGARLEWDALPSRVASVIGRRIGQLSGSCRALLDVASVEGDQFSAQICARVLGMDEHEVQRLLSRELGRQQRLVTERGMQLVNGQRLDHYRFRHDLFRLYIYGQLDKAERRYLHENVGVALEALYGEETATITSTLAHHFQKAETTAKAIIYTLQAGDAARALYAHELAIDYYRQALALQKQDKLYGEAGRTLMKIGLSHHQAFHYRRAQQAFDEGCLLWQKAAAHLPAPRLLPGGTLRVGTGPPLKVDPALANDILSIPVIRHLFAGLVEARETMEIIPDVAARWEIVDEGRTYIFHLRPDVCWSDGTPLTAHDFEFSWKRVLAPETHSPTATCLYDIRGAQAYHQGQAGHEQVGVTARNAQTLIVRLEKPTAYFLRMATATPARALPRHAIMAAGESGSEVGWMVNSGPFCLRSWGEEGMELVRNEAYHRPVRGNVERILLEFWSAAGGWERLARLYETGSLDVLRGLHFFYDGGSLQRLVERHLDDLFVSAGYGSLAIAFNLYRPPFSDTRVRLAFALATDRESFVRESSGVTVIPALGGIVPPGIPGHAPDIGLPFDPASARALLAEAGFPGGQGFPSTSLVFPHWPGFDLYCRWLTRQWQTLLGVSVEWQLLDRTTFHQVHSQNRGPLSAWFYTAGDPHSYLRDGWLENQCLWPDEQYRQQIEHARQIPDQEEQLRLFRQADRFLVENAYILPLSYQPSDKLLLRQQVKHYPLSIVGSPFWEDAIVDPAQGKEPHPSLAFQRSLEPERERKPVAQKHRTAGELLSLAELEQEQLRQHAAAGAEARHIRELEALVAKQEETWTVARQLLEQGDSHYDEVVDLLVKLHDLAIHQGTKEAFEERLQEIRAAYSGQKALLWRMDRAGLPRTKSV